MLGVPTSFQGVQFNREQFHEDHVCLAYDMEKLGDHASGSGMNLSHGQLLKIHVEGAGKAGVQASEGVIATADTYVKKAYTTCRYDVIMELTSTGCSVHS